MKKALGKGLDALLPSLPQGLASLRDATSLQDAASLQDATPLQDASAAPDEAMPPDAFRPKDVTAAGAFSAVVELDVGSIEPNPEQPRRIFDDEAIGQLAESIASVGVVQPILVAQENGYYRIIAGERRWRAARAAGLTKIPAIVGNYTEGQKIEVALVENLQRQDLNPIEEAGGYERLIAEYGYTQEKIARAVGKSRPAIANSIRLLGLSGRIRDMLSDGRITAGHARSLLAVESEARREYIADYIVGKGLNVRQAEALVNAEAAAADKEARARGSAGDNKTDGAGAPGANIDERRAAAVKKIEDTLRSHFSTRVSLDDSGGKSGKIIIEYYGDDDLNRLLELIGLGNEF